MSLKGGAIWYQFFRYHCKTFLHDEGRMESVAAVGTSSIAAAAAAMEVAVAFWR